MLISRDALIENAHQLREAFGDDINPFRHAGKNLQRAEKTVDGILPFNHLGTHWTEVGRRDIDWSAPEHNHQEWPAQLNRFFQLPALAAAYQETQDEKYANAAFDYIDDWIESHPPTDDWAIAPYDNTLNLCIRNQQWFRTLTAFLDSPVFDDEFVDRMIESGRAQLEFLCDNLSSHGNWRIAQADSLFTNGMRLKGIPEAEHWRELARRVLNDAFHRQVLPDGAHWERNPSYHNWMKTVFTKYWRLQQNIPDAGMAMEAEGVARMHDYAAGTTRPNGYRNAMHDCTGARTGRRPNRMLEERNEFREEAGLPEGNPPTSQFFPDAGQAFLRDSWERDATYLTFDATNWGGAHCHMSRNNVQLHAHGRSLIVDPGSFTYETSDPMKAYGKGTRSHSTLNLNGWNQSEDNPETRYENVPGYDLVASEYAGGYWPGKRSWSFEPDHGQGIFARHHRSLLWIHDTCAVVLDHLMHDYGNNPPDLEINWQLCEGNVVLDPEERMARTDHDDANVLMLFPVVPDEMEMSLHVGEKDPIKGWLPGDGEYVPAPMLSLTSPSHSRFYTDVATVMIPHEGTEPPSVKAEGNPDDGCGINHLRLEWADGTTDDLTWTARLFTAIGERADMKTDASLAHLQRDQNGEVTQGFVVDGTYLDPFYSEELGSPATFVFSPSGERT
ncbi:MAG: heparinase II/III family protein [Planctomycetes bacterium]|nr:heparinase II/III family protein [Planctomycetota bacterium]